MNPQEQHEYPEMFLHYQIALATGLNHHNSLKYAQAQIRVLTDIEHLIVKS